MSDQTPLYVSEVYYVLSDELNLKCSCLIRCVILPKLPNLFVFVSLFVKDYLPEKDYDCFIKWLLLLLPIILFCGVNEKRH